MSLYCDGVGCHVLCLWHGILRSRHIGAVSGNDVHQTYIRIIIVPYTDVKACAHRGRAVTYEGLRVKLG